MTLSVVHAMAPAPFGGLESVVLSLTAGQAAAGYDVTVFGVFNSDPKGQPFWSAVERSPEVRAVPLVLGGRQYLAERRALRRVIEEHDADVLHTHGYRPDVLLGSVGKALGVATVTTVHGFTGNDWKDRLYEWLQRRALRRYHAVVAVSQPLGRDLRTSGVPPQALHVVPNAWTPESPPLSRAEARRALELPSSASIVGWVGRLSAEKAPELALAAVSPVASGEAHLAFIGDGPMRSTLEEETRGAGLADRVHWLGVVPGAARFLTAFDALLLTSWTEGTPIVLLEAMAARVPIVTTSVGGIPDVVCSDEAVLVDAGDTMAMTTALDLILAGDPEARARGAKALDRLRRDHATRPWVERYDDIYRTCKKD